MACSRRNRSQAWRLAGRASWRAPAADLTRDGRDVLSQAGRRYEFGPAWPRAGTGACPGRVPTGLSAPFSSDSHADGDLDCCSALGGDADADRFDDDGAGGDLEQVGFVCLGHPGAQVLGPGDRAVVDSTSAATPAEAVGQYRAFCRCFWRLHPGDVIGYAAQVASLGTRLSR
jgi:hypothetical protein